MAFASSAVPPQRRSTPNARHQPTMNLTISPRQQKTSDLGAKRRRAEGFGRLMQRLALCLFLGLCGSAVFAKDSLMASAYAPVVTDLIEAFHAEEATCPLATYQHDVCFVARPAGASRLAEVLTEVTGQYTSAELRLGPWRSANGVWAVELTFGAGAYGSVELFLTEPEPGAVRGVFIFHGPR